MAAFSGWVGPIPERKPTADRIPLAGLAKFTVMEGFLGSIPEIVPANSENKTKPSSVLTDDVASKASMIVFHFGSCSEGK